MKTFILILIFSLGALAQNQEKRYLIERQSSASCPNCRSAHLQFQPFLEMQENVVVIAYQFHSPSYFDPMGRFSQEFVASRMDDYYNNRSFPTAFTDGVRDGHLLSTQDNDFSDAEAPVGINFNATIIDNIVTVTGNIESYENNGEILSPNTRLFVVINEDVVRFNSSAGSNGETVFYDVMRYMVGGAGGNEITWEGMNFEFSFEQEIDETVIDSEELEVVVFVQNLETQTVFQAWSKKVDTQTSIENRKKTELIIYPNPTNDILNISGFELSDKLAIYNFSGEMIELVYSNNMDISSYPIGYYFIRSESGFTIPFIKN